MLMRAFNLLCLLLGVIWSFLVASLGLPLMLLNERMAHACHRIWARGLVFLLAIEVEIEGLENIQGVPAAVFASNHASMFDIFILGSLPLNFKWISKAEVRRIPFIGWAMLALGCYFVKRDGKVRDLETMKKVEMGLKDGKSVWIFPEGTRTRTGKLLPLKKGSFRLAQNAQIPLIPVGLLGTFSIAPPGKLPSHRGHQVKIRFGKPMSIRFGVPLIETVEQFRRSLETLLEHPQVKPTTGLQQP